MFTLGFKIKKIPNLVILLVESKLWTQQVYNRLQVQNLEKQRGTYAASFSCQIWGIFHLKTIVLILEIIPQSQIKVHVQALKFLDSGSNWVFKKHFQRCTHRTSSLNLRGGFLRPDIILSIVVLEYNLRKFTFKLKDQSCMLEF